MMRMVLIMMKRVGVRTEVLLQGVMLITIRCKIFFYLIFCLGGTTDC